MKKIWFFPAVILLVAGLAAWAAEVPPKADALDWGTEVDGIQCATCPVKAVFTTGEFIVVDVLYRNTTSHAKTVCIRPDPFWRWMRYRISDTSGPLVTRPPTTDGTEKGLEKTDFRTIRPGETVSCRATLEAIWLEPGKYRITVDINTINRIDHIIRGFDQFCRENDLSVWVAPIQSGVGVFTVTAMPPIQWGESGSNALVCGIGKVDFREGNVIVPVFMKNIGTLPERKYFDGSVFELEFDGERYLPADWPAQNARQMHIPSGREIGPIPLALVDYISASDQHRHRAAPRPLTRLQSGPHRLRVVYVGMNGSTRIPSPEVTVTVIQGH